MAAPETVITITHDKEVIGDINNAITGQGLVMYSFEPKAEAEEICRFLMQLSSGVRMGKIMVGVNSLPGVPASGTVTCAGVNAADTVTVAGQAFTAVNGGSPTSVQFDMSGTDTQTAANLAAALTAHTTIGKYVKASNVAGVVTITAVSNGYLGNLVTLATSNNTRLAKSGTSLASGAGNNVQTTTTYKYGV
jgi:hypothetical protein